MIQPGAAGSASLPNDTLVWPGHVADDGGSTTGVRPTGSLTATPAGLVLKSTRGEFRVSREHVTRIGWGRLYPWFFCAVQIHHQEPNCSRELQFRPMGAGVKAILRRLEQLGYPR
jgi:hypothetical protein